MRLHVYVLQLLLLFASASAQCGSGTYIQPTCIDNPNYYVSERKAGRDDDWDCYDLAFQNKCISGGICQTCCHSCAVACATPANVVYATTCAACPANSGASCSNCTASTGCTCNPGFSGPNGGPCVLTVSTTPTPTPTDTRRPINDVYEERENIKITDDGAHDTTTPEFSNAVSKKPSAILVFLSLLCVSWFF